MNTTAMKIWTTPPFCPACKFPNENGRPCDTGCEHDLASAVQESANFVRGLNLITNSLGIDFYPKRSTMGSVNLKILNMKCAQNGCGKDVVSLGNGKFAHAGGGEQAVRCQKCNQVSGDANGVRECQSCGDSTMLVADHMATPAS